MKFLLIRHAESEKNIGDRHGDSDKNWLLTPDGINKAKAFSVRLAEAVNIEKIYCSDSSTCLQTANILGQALNLTPIAEPKLRSINFGVISGLSLDEVSSKYPEIMFQINEYHAGRLHPKDYKIPNAESNAKFELRIKTFLMQILDQPLNQLCVVAHRSSITMMLNITRNLPNTTDNGDYQVFDLPPLSISVMEIHNNGSKGSIYSVGSTLRDLARLQVF